MGTLPNQLGAGKTDVWAHMPQSVAGRPTQRARREHTYTYTQVRLVVAAVLTELPRVSDKVRFISSGLSNRPVLQVPMGTLPNQLFASSSSRWISITLYWVEGAS